MEWLAHIWVSENEFSILTVQCPLSNIFHAHCLLLNIIHAHCPTIFKHFPCSLSIFKHFPCSLSTFKHFPCSLSSVHFQTLSILTVHLQTFSMLTVHFQTNFPFSLSSFKLTLIVFSLRMIILADPVSGWRIIFTCIFETCIFEACISEACIFEVSNLAFWFLSIPTFKVSNDRENPKYNGPKLFLRY